MATISIMDNREKTKTWDYYCLVWKKAKSLRGSKFFVEVGVMIFLPMIALTMLGLLLYSATNSSAISTFVNEERTGFLITLICVVLLWLWNGIRAFIRAPVEIYNSQEERAVELSSDVDRYKKELEIATENSPSLQLSVKEGVFDTEKMVCVEASAKTVAPCRDVHVYFVDCDPPNDINFEQLHQCLRVSDSDGKTSAQVKKGIPVKFDAVSFPHTSGLIIQTVNENGGADVKTVHFQKSIFTFMATADNVEPETIRFQIEPTNDEKIVVSLCENIDQQD